MNLHPITAQAVAKREFRKEDRAGLNRVSAQDQYQRAAGQFLRMALRGRLANPHTLQAVSLEMFGKQYSGINLVMPARRIMMHLDQNPKTTDFPTLNLSLLKEAYYASKILSSPERKEQLQGSQRFYIAFRRAKETVSAGFASLV